MKLEDIAHYRLASLQIAKTRLSKAEEVVAFLGAMQGQDYQGSLWAIGLRLQGSLQTEIEQAINKGRIVRTWLMRGTLHFAAAKDLHWMLDLFASGLLKSGTSRDQRLGFDKTIYKRCEKILVKALQGHKQLMRDEIYSLLEQGGIQTSSQRGYHILWRLGLEGLICFAAYHGKQPSFALLDEWVPKAKSLSQAEAAAELAKRYFTSHGPATLQDFTRWSGLKVAEAKTALQEHSSSLIQKTMEGINYWLAPDVILAKNPTKAKAYLLPGFDEYILGYKNRSAVLEDKFSGKIIPGNNGVFLPTLIIDGQVLGTWRRTSKKTKVVINLLPFGKLSANQRNLLHEAAERYGSFLNLPVTLE